MKIAKMFKTALQQVLSMLVVSFSLPKGDKHVFKCNCGKEIIIMTNICDKSNSGRGTCECGAVVYVN